MKFILIGHSSCSTSCVLLSACKPSDSGPSQPRVDVVRFKQLRLRFEVRVRVKIRVRARVRVSAIVRCSW